VGEELAHRHFVAARESGNEARDGIIEFEFSILLQQEDGDGGELLLMEPIA
jgi:hypothetical protein